MQHSLRKGAVITVSHQSKGLQLRCVQCLEAGTDGQRPNAREAAATEGQVEDVQLRGREVLEAPCQRQGPRVTEAVPDKCQGVGGVADARQELSHDVERGVGDGARDMPAPQAGPGLVAQVADERGLQEV